MVSNIKNIYRDIKREKSNGHMNMGPDSKDWVIGLENELGQSRGYILSRSNLASTCPTNSKNDWEYYTNINWIPTNDVQLNCIGNHTIAFTT